MRDRILSGLELSEPIGDKSLGRVLYDYLNKFENQIALIDGVTGDQLSYQTLQNIACNLSARIKNLGYNQEDVLGICAENNIYFFCPLLAAFYLGISIAPISQNYNIHELQHVLTIIKPKLIFCTKLNSESFLNLQNTNGFIKTIVVIDSDEAKPGIVTLKSFINNDSYEGNVDEFQPVHVNIKNHTAVILFSSGTSGLPKGVMLTHKNILMGINHGLDSRIYRKNFDNPTNLLQLPINHAFGLISSLFILSLGNSIIVLSKFKESLFLSCIQKYQIKSINLVPTLMVILSKSLILENYNIKCLKYILAGASSISENLENMLKTKLGVSSIRQIYGLTECTFGVLTVPFKSEKPGSVGKVTPGISVIITNPENEKILGPYEIGEICVKGEMVMKGYYNNPEATKKSFNNKGWFKTGDLGYYDDDAYFYIVDRLKELIKYKSFQVAPAEIESLLQQHCKVLEVAVVGLPDERDGELPLAFIVRQPNVELSEDEVKKFVASRLSHHNHLHGGVRFVDKLPKNSSGKILRRVLKQIIKNEA
ncbi:luciferin 4-monooxygenase-like [Onthophagus taurus]|uniref:luciferin 4-monooxygenase-like n=1 Tax=Onthophagus taurus TaxID=166361 RepID=UPI0039BDD5FB